jgi:MFS family permease
VMFFTFGSMPQTVVPRLGAADLGLSAAVIGVALGIGGACRFVGTLVAGWVSDHVSRKAALIPGLAASAAGVALLAVQEEVWAWLAAIVVMSLASSPIAVATTMLADRANGRQVGRKLGPFRFVGDLGMICGPVAVTLVLQHAGTRAAVLAVAGLLTVCAVACALGLTETAGRAARPAEFRTRPEEHWS